MPKKFRVAGETSIVEEIFIQNAGATNGAGLTGLVFNAAGLTAYYKRNKDSASAAITLANITTIGTFANNGFREVDATNMPGVYEFDPPNAAFASGADGVVFLLKGATNMAPVVFEVHITKFDPQDSVRAGLTALPNANAAASGGLLTSGTGANQLDVDSSGRANIGKWLGTLVTAATAGIPDVNAKNVNNAAAANHSGDAYVRLGAPAGASVSADIAAVKADTAAVKTKTDQFVFTTANKVDARAFTVDDKTGYALSSGGVQAIWDALTSALTTSGSIGKRIVDFLTGDIYARLGAPAGASTAADIAAVKSDTGAIKTKTDSLTFTTANKVDARAFTVDDKTGYALSAGGVQAIWDALSAALTTANSIGKRIVDFLTGDVYARVGAPAGASIAADIAAVKTVADSIKTSTDNLPSDPADQSLVIAATTAIYDRIGAPVGASISADIAAVQARVNVVPVALTGENAISVTAPTGLTLTIEVQRRADGFRIDFDDDTFKSSGWTTRLGSMVEDSTTDGLYSKTLTVDVWDEGWYRALVHDSAISTGPIATVDLYVTRGVGLRRAPSGIVPFAPYPDFHFQMYSEAGELATGLSGIVAEVLIGDAADYVACVNAPEEVSGGTYRIDLHEDDLAGRPVTLRFTGDGAAPTVISLFTAEG